MYIIYVYMYINTNLLSFGLWKSLSYFVRINSHEIKLFYEVLSVFTRGGKNLKVQKIFCLKGNIQ